MEREEIACFPPPTGVNCLSGSIAQAVPTPLLRCATRQMGFRDINKLIVPRVDPSDYFFVIREQSSRLYHSEMVHN
jgi:hypothetical protein